MSFRHKILVGSALGVQFALIIPYYVVETVVKSSIRDWFKPAAYRN